MTETTLNIVLLIIFAAIGVSAAKACRLTCVKIQPTAYQVFTTLMFLEIISDESETRNKYFLLRTVFENVNRHVRSCLPISRCSIKCHESQPLKCREIFWAWSTSSEK